MHVLCSSKETGHLSEILDILIGLVFGHLSDISDMKSGQKEKQINRELIRKNGDEIIKHEEIADIAR